MGPPRCWIHPAVSTVKVAKGRSRRVIHGFASRLLGEREDGGGLAILIDSEGEKKSLTPPSKHKLEIRGEEDKELTGHERRRMESSSGEGG